MVWWFLPLHHSRQEMSGNGISLNLSWSNGMHSRLNTATDWTTEKVKVRAKHLHCKLLSSVLIVGEVLLRDVTRLNTILWSSSSWVFRRLEMEKQTAVTKGMTTHCSVLIKDWLCSNLEPQKNQTATQSCCPSKLLDVTEGRSFKAVGN